MAQGPYKKAMGYRQRALSLYREIGDRLGQQLDNLGIIHGDLGDYQQAIECMQQGLDIDEW